MAKENQALWERRQAELWDRVFQVTQDVMSLVDALDDTKGYRVVGDELARSAGQVGAELVRANASDNARQFEEHIKEARWKAIEADYWLRLVHVLQQSDRVRRDLSSLITQYAAVINLLQQFRAHATTDRELIARHAKGPRVSL